PAEETGLFVTYLIGDCFHREIAGLQHLLGFLETERLDVVKRRHSGCLAEAAYERPFGKPRDFDHRGHRRGCAIVVRRPFLAAGNDGIGRLVETGSGGERPLTGVMPVENEDPSHLHGLAVTHKTGNEIKREVLPAGAAARHGDSLTLPGED